MKRFLVRDEFLSALEFPSEEKLQAAVRLCSALRCGWTAKTEEEASALNSQVTKKERKPVWMVFDLSICGALGAYLPVYSRVDPNELHWSQKERLC